MSGPAIDHLATAGATTADGAPLLAVENLSIDVRRRHGDTRLVEGASFTIDRGATLGVVGESGSGKSITAMSLLRLLPGALRIATGSVRFDGVELTTVEDRALRRIRGSEIGVIFQDPHNSLNPAYTVGNQLVETIRAHLGGSRQAATTQAIALLDRVGIHRAASRMRDYPHQLSGGMAQRVMIAMAISCAPKLLIADEPTTALDVTVQAQILALLRDLQADTQMGLLVISHDFSVIAEMADRVAVMYAGQIVEQGSAIATLSEPTHPYTAALLAAQPAATPKQEPLASILGNVPAAGEQPSGCRFHPRCTHATEICTSVVPELAPSVRHPASIVRCLREDELLLPGVAAVRDKLVAEIDTPVLAEREQTPTLLEVRGLGKQYTLRTGRLGRSSILQAVDDVSFDLAVGETLGLVGESGAGKSTVGRMVLGLTPATSGTVRFEGTELRGTNHSARRDVQVVFQNPYASLDPLMTIGDSIAEPLAVHRVGDERARRARVAELLEAVGLDPGFAVRRPSELSGGQRQRVAIARGLALNPKLIVCDEPVSALDVSTQAQVINLLLELQDRLGLSYLFVGHDLSVVHRLSDRIAVMYRGRIVELGPADEIYHRPRHPYSQALLAAVLSIDPAARKLGTLPDEPSGEPPAGGCPYAHRCPIAMDVCSTTEPPVVNSPSTAGVDVRCHAIS